MDTPKKLIVGYDLCEDNTQISCFSYKTMEPISISLREGEENCMIPTLLCFRKETKQWLIGEDAISCATAGAGILVEHLLEKAQSKEEIEIYGQKFSGVALLEKYLRKTLLIIKNYFPTEQITKLVVTIRSTDPAFVDKIYEALAILGLEKDRVVVMNHAGVYLYYALNQDKSFWLNDVGMFEFNEDGLYFYQIRMNRRTKPMVASIMKMDYSGTLTIPMLKQRDINSAYIFEGIANSALFKQIITTLYLTGSGFEGTWASEVIKGLCVGRRVFVGQNLFTKGACYAAKELAGDKGLEDFVLLGDDMITSSITVKVYCDTAYKEMTLTEAGKNWFEVNHSIEVIPDGDTELEISVKNIMSKEVKKEFVSIDQFPKRPNRMTRLLINLTCKDKLTGLITVTDLGFGDIMKESGQSVEICLNI